MRLPKFLVDPGEKQTCSIESGVLCRRGNTDDDTSDEEGEQEVGAGNRQVASSLIVGDMINRQSP